MPGAGIYLVLDSASTAGRPLEQIAKAAVEGGIKTVQLRCKDMSAAGFLEELLACARHTSGHATLLVNDRIDVYLAARAAGADVQGIHLGQSDIPAGLARELIGPTAVLGLSAAAPAEIAAANLLNERAPGTIDYLGVGAVHATPTKKDHPQPLGYSGLAGITASSALGAVAIGGLDASDIPGVLSSGATGMAVVRAICAATDPRAATKNLLTLWEGTTP